jgi:DNA polymerase-1
VPERPPVASGGLLLFDGSALAYRSHYAMAQSGLSRADGLPTGATYGFTSEVLRLLKEVKPTHAAVVFDAPGKTFRHEIYSEYKATRSAMPEELAGQLGLIREATAALGVPVIMTPGCEADDLVASIAVKARDAGIPVWIVTGDKDFLQLVDDKIRVYQLARPTQSAGVIDREGVIAKFKVPPERVVDVLALMGDAIDNVKGVPGVGELTAQKLVQKYGSLDQVLAEGPKSETKRLGEKLAEHADAARLALKLVTLDTSCPLPVPFEDLAWKGVNAEVAEALFRSLEFKALAQEFAPKPKPVAQTYRQVTTEPELDALAAALAKADLVSVDTETTALAQNRAVLVGLSFSMAPGIAWYVPLNAKPRIIPDPPDAPFWGQNVLERLKPFLEDPRPTKCGQNSKYDILILRAHGVRMRGLRTDTMLASFLLDPTQREHGLDALALRHFEYRKVRTQELIGKGRDEMSMDLVPIEHVSEYACEDADFTRRLAELFLPRLKEEGLEKLHDEVEIPLVSVLADMEEKGVRVDRPLLKKMASEWCADVERIQEEIRKIAGPDFNPNSPKQLGELLFDELKVHEQTGYRPKKTKTGWATGQEVLEELKAVEICRLILEFRAVSKLVSTYVLPLPELVREDGRIHASFNQTGASTGRLSCNDPNLQNIPIRTEAGKKIRLAFLPTADDWELVSADYSQIELRLLAHFANDEALITAFREGRDIHRETAARVFNLKPEAVDATARSRAKVINFGLLYGMGPQRVAQETELSFDEAKTFIERYFAAFPKVRGYLDSLKEKARAEGFVSTIMGRRRPIPDINSPNHMLKAQAERLAVNTPIQGSAADLIKVAMVAIHRRLIEQKRKSHLIIQVHDELLLDVPRSELAEVTALVKHEMENAWQLAVPLKVDLGHGKNWLEAQH